MATAGSLQLSQELGICKNHRSSTHFQNVLGRGKLQFSGSSLSSLALRQNLWSTHLSRRVNRVSYPVPYRYNHFRCHSFLSPGSSFNISSVKNAALTLTRSCNSIQHCPHVLKLVPAVGVVVFAIWGLGPLMRQSRKLFLHIDSNWKKSSTYRVMTSYLQPLLLWAGAILVCRALDPLVLPTEASQAVKIRLINFVRSLSTVLSFAYCLSSVIQEAQKFFMETNDPTDARNMGFQFAGKAVYSAVWVAAVSLFMELLGFSTQKWLTAGGLGTVLLTLAGREIFTNFLSSAIIHATRPFIANEWIQTKIEGYEVSGTVEHVGWWSPTVIRGEDREAVYIPNHKFTVNVVRNLSQKAHWRIKTHLAISHLDVAKINSIVADMRKVLAKNPQVEQQKLHRRVFLDNVNPENQALLILVSCFVKTSHFEEYLCVKLRRLHTISPTGLSIFRNHPRSLEVKTLRPRKSGSPFILRAGDQKKVEYSASKSVRYLGTLTCVGHYSTNCPKDMVTKALLLNELKEAILLDLLRVIRHHRARLATPIRTVQKIFSDADLDNVPHVDSVFQGGTAATRPPLLIEPSYKINGEDRKKSQARLVRPNSEEDSKSTTRSTPDNQADIKAGTSTVGSKSQDTTLPDSKTKEMPTHEAKVDVKVGEIPNADLKEANNATEKPSFNPKPSHKTTAKSTSKSAAKSGSKTDEVSSSDSRTLSENSKQLKKVGQESSRVGSAVDSLTSSPEARGEKPGSFTSHVQLKPHEERSTADHSSSSKPTLEENIVLGVALEGSKRTLPIEDGMASPPKPAAEKELATCRTGNGPPKSEKDRADKKNSSAPSPAANDQSNQQE